MKTWLCLAGAVVLLICGWLMPVHMRAFDVAVLQRAPRNPAPPVSAAAIKTPLAGMGSQPVTPFFVSLDHREKALNRLQASPSPVAQALLRTRDLTNTVLFPPSSSASGQAFDIAVSICGLLAEENQLAPGLLDAMLTRAALADRGGDSQPIEEILMDSMSLGQRLSWRDLVIFMGGINDPQTLATLAQTARKAGSELPALFFAVQMSQDPAAVARYVSDFNQTGLSDLVVAEQWGPGAVRALLQSRQRVYASRLRQQLVGWVPFGSFSRATSDYTLREPHFALILKWVFYLGGGFLLAAAMAPVRADEPGRVRWSRNLLIAAGFLLVVLLVGEPFLAQEGQKGEFPFRLRLPSVGSAAANPINQVKSTNMNQSNLTTSLLTLLLFFVLQALIYTACLAKLAENLRQKVPSRIKLKLLENEEHLFDAGLYLGFVGTIVCFILASLNLVQFSLMAAYSSTSFGIVFVSILKIFHVRPARRRLLLESEQEPVAAATPVFATTIP